MPIAAPDVERAVVQRRGGLDHAAGLHPPLQAAEPAERRGGVDTRNGPRRRGTWLRTPARRRARRYRCRPRARRRGARLQTWTWCLGAGGNSLRTRGCVGGFGWLTGCPLTALPPYRLTALDSPDDLHSRSPGPHSHGRDRGARPPHRRADGRAGPGDRGPARHARAAPDRAAGRRPRAAGGGARPRQDPGGAHPRLHHRRPASTGSSSPPTCSRPT